MPPWAYPDFQDYQRFIQKRENIFQKTKNCEECEKEHLSIVALQMGLTCGHVSCRDSSNGKYAIKHFEETGYPGIKAISEDIWK